MSEYLTQNSSNAPSVKQILMEQILGETSQTINKGIKRTQDIIDAGQSQTSKKQAQQVQVGQRPSLPPAGKPKQPEFLAVVAKAFAEAFHEIAVGTIDQNKSYAQLQQLNWTSSESVLRTTNIAMTKELQQIKLASQISAYQKKTAKEDSILGHVMLGVGVAVIAVTLALAIASTVATGGLSLLAVAGAAGEMGGELGAEGAVGASVEGVDLSAEAGDTSYEMSELGTSSDVDNEPPEIEDETPPETPPEGQPGETGEADESAQTRQTTNEELNESNQENEKSEESFKSKAAKWLVKRVAHLAIAGGCASPMLVSGLQSFTTAKMLNRTADSQKQVGNAMATMQLTNSDNQFYQQIQQQASSVVQEETNDTGQVMTTFTDITTAVGHISTGLANAV